MSAEAKTLAERVVDEMLAKDAFSEWLGIKVDLIEPGHCISRMIVREDMLNGFSRCHGGIQFSLADSALAFAANAHGLISMTIENSISYPEGVFAGDELTAEAIEVSSSRKLANYDVKIKKADGTIVGWFRGTVYRTTKQFFPSESK